MPDVGPIVAESIARGLDVFKLMPSPFLSQHELSAAALVHTSLTFPFSSLGSRNAIPFCSAFEYCPISAQ